MKSGDIGVRELRQNLSKHLKTVERGRSLRVLERGRPVAMLIPLPEENSSLDTLIREGRAVPARGDLASVKPLPARSSGPSLSEALEALREEKLP